MPEIPLLWHVAASHTPHTYLYFQVLNSFEVRGARVRLAPSWGLHCRSSEPQAGNLTSHKDWRPAGWDLTSWEREIRAIGGLGGACSASGGGCVYRVGGACSASGGCVYRVALKFTGWLAGFGSAVSSQWVSASLTLQVWLSGVALKSPVKMTGTCLAPSEGSRSFFRWCRSCRIWQIRAWNITQEGRRWSQSCPSCTNNQAWPRMWWVINRSISPQRGRTVPWNLPAPLPPPPWPWDVSWECSILDPRGGPSGEPQITEHDWGLDHIILPLPQTWKTWVLYGIHTRTQIYEKTMDTFTLTLTCRKPCEHAAPCSFKNMIPAYQAKRCEGITCLVAQARRTRLDISTWCITDAFKTSRVVEDCQSIRRALDGMRDDGTINWSEMRSALCLMTFRGQAIAF